MTIRSTESARKPEQLKSFASPVVIMAEVKVPMPPPTDAKTDAKMEAKKTIEYYMPKCIWPETKLQKIARAFVSLLGVTGAVGYAYGAFFVWHRVADKCISLLMLSLAAIWVLIGFRRSLRHLEFYAKVSLSMMCTAIGMLLFVPIHAASVEVRVTGDYQAGMFFGVRASVFIFFFAIAFWYLAWICFATDRVIEKISELLEKKQREAAGEI